jgi:hypothetical protein
MGSPNAVRGYLAQKKGDQCSEKLTKIGLIPCAHSRDNGAKARRFSREPSLFGRRPRRVASLTLGKKETMSRDTRFDLGFAAFQAAFVLAISTATGIKYIEPIMICLAISIPSTFAMWTYRVPTTKTEKNLNGIAKILGHSGALFAFAFLMGSFSYVAAVVFLGLWLFWMISLKFPEGSSLP